jgi:hypothetical protein
MYDIYSRIFIFFLIFFFLLSPFLYVCFPIDNSVIPCVCREWGESVSGLDETLS